MAEPPRSQDSLPAPGFQPRAKAPRRAAARWRLRCAARLTPVLAVLCILWPKLWQGDYKVDTGWYAAIGLQAFRAAADGHLGALWSLAERTGLDAGGALLQLPYWNKPPLPFWIHGGVLWALGPSIWAARLPSVAAAALAVWLTGRLGARLAGPATGVSAACCLALTVGFLNMGSAISLDLWLLVCLLGAALGAATAVHRRQRRWLVWAGVPLGLGLLCKPLVALLAVPMFGAWLLAAGKRSLLGALAGGAGVAVALAAAWYVPMWLAHGEEFVDQHFRREIGMRAAGLLPSNEGAESPWYYVLLLARTYWPWGALAALGGVALARREYSPRAAQAALWCLIWGAAWVVLLSAFADKRPRYLLPVYPAGAIFGAVWLHHAGPTRLLVARRAALRWGVPVGLAIGVVVAALPVRIYSTIRPEWAAAIAKLQTLPEGAALYDGGLNAEDAARLYLHLGRWATPTRDRLAQSIATPEPGAYVVTRGPRGEAWEGEPWFEAGDVRVVRVR